MVTKMIAATAIVHGGEKAIVCISEEDQDMQTIYAEDVGHYWKTSRTSPDVWLARATSQIEEAGGDVQQEAFGRAGEQAAFMISFTVGGEFYKLIWPVLPSKIGDDRAARIQAATMLYRDVKARCMSAKVLGMRAAFFNFLLLADGRTAGEIATPELAEMVPKMLREASRPPESTEGEWTEIDE